MVDGQRWAGFDVIDAERQLLHAAHVPAVRPVCLAQPQRRGAGTYLGYRALRLGVPFVAALLTIVPLAYYPSWLQAGGTPGFPKFWIDMVIVGPWPSGPPWFLAVLLLFDTAAALAFAALPRRSRELFGRAAPTWGRAFGLLLSGLVLAYLPLLFVFGPSRWVSLGPLAVQASRIDLYGVSFAVGVLLGALGVRPAAASGHGRHKSDIDAAWNIERRSLQFQQGECDLTRDPQLLR